MTDMLNTEPTDGAFLVIPDGAESDDVMGQATDDANEMLATLLATVQRLEAQVATLLEQSVDDIELIEDDHDDALEGADFDSEVGGGEGSLDPAEPTLVNLGSDATLL